MIHCLRCGVRFLPPESRSMTVLTRTGDQPEEVRQTLQVTPEFLERYTIGKLVGAGGLGCVYQALDRRRSVPVAIKVLVKPERNQSIRFLREGKLLYSIRHPHVLPVYEIGKLGDHPYLVMEFMPGGTLRNRMREKMSLGESLFAIRDVLSGLQVCHERGVVHRDMKPENVLMTPDGGAKVADLGIAKDYNDVDENLTATGTIIGSPKYMAPEQVRGEAPVIATDLYAVGMMLYEMVTGSYPFKVTNVFQLLKCHEQLEPARVETIAPETPATLALVIHRALAKRIGDRPRTAEEFLAPIDRLLRDLGKRGEAPVRPPPEPASPGTPSGVRRKQEATKVTDTEPPVAIYLPESVPYLPPEELSAEVRRKRLRMRQAAGGAVTLGAMLGLVLWTRSLTSIPPLPSPSASALPSSAPPTSSLSPASRAPSPSNGPPAVGALPASTASTAPPRATAPPSAAASASPSTTLRSPPVTSHTPTPAATPPPPTNQGQVAADLAPPGSQAMNPPLPPAANQAAQGPPGSPPFVPLGQQAAVVSPPVAAQAAGTLPPDPPLPMVDSSRLIGPTFLRHRDEVNRLHLAGFPKTLTAFTARARWMWSLGDHRLVAQDRFPGDVIRITATGDACLLRIGDELHVEGSDGARVRLPVDPVQILARPAEADWAWAGHELVSRGARVAIGQGGNLVAARVGDFLHVWTKKGPAFAGNDKVPAPPGVIGLSLSPDGERLIVFQEGEAPSLWEVQPLARITRLDKLDPGLAMLEFSGDSSILVAQDDLTSMVYDGRDGSLRGRYSMVGPEERRGIESGVVRIALSADGRFLATAHSYGGWVHVYDISACKGPVERGLIRDKKEVVSWRHPTIGLWDVDFSPSGGQLIFSALDGLVLVYETKSGKLRMPTDGPLGRSAEVRLSPQGHWLLIRDQRGMHRYDLLLVEPQPDWLLPASPTDPGAQLPGSGWDMGHGFLSQIDDKGRVTRSSRRQLDLYVPPSRVPAWSRPLIDGTPRSTACFDGDRIVLLEPDAVRLLETATGKELDVWPHFPGETQTSFLQASLEGGHGRWYHAFTSTLELQVREVTGNRVAYRYQDTGWLARLLSQSFVPDGRLGHDGRRFYAGPWNQVLIELDMVGQVTSMIQGLSQGSDIHPRDPWVLGIAQAEGRFQLVARGRRGGMPEPFWRPESGDFSGGQLVGNEDGTVLASRAHGGGVFVMKITYPE